MDFDRSVRIGRPPEVVFAFLVDVQEYAARPVLSMERDPPGRTAVGARWREVVRLAPMLRCSDW